MIRATAPLLLLHLIVAPALSQPKTAITPEQLQQVQQRVRTIKPPPYLFNKDGTPYRPGAAPSPAPAAALKPAGPPAAGTLGDWIRYAHRNITAR